LDGMFIPAASAGICLLRAGASTSELRPQRRNALRRPVRGGGPEEAHRAPRLAHRHEMTS
jgi:hypothetical protein